MLIMNEIQALQTLNLALQIELAKAKVEAVSNALKVSGFDAGTEFLDEAVVHLTNAMKELM